jgi:hypothetical protein
VTDSPAAPDRSLKAQPWREDLANARQIAQGWANVTRAAKESELADAFATLARLVETAVAKLDGASGPPNKQDET